MNTVTPVGYPTGTQFVESHVAVELKTVLLQCLELNFIHLQCVQGGAKSSETAILVSGQIK